MQWCGRSLVLAARFRFRDVGLLSLKGLPAPLATVQVVDDDDVVDVVIPASMRPPTTAGHGRRRALIAGIAGLVVVLAGVALAVARSDSGPAASALVGLPKRTGYTPKYETVACPNDVREQAPAAQCGHLTVPEDRKKPHGRQVVLLVQRVRARVPQAKAATPSIDLCGCEDLGNSITRDHAELIQLSARGFPGSDPMLTCPEMSSERIAALTQRSDLPAEVACEVRMRSRSAMRESCARGSTPLEYNYRVGSPGRVSTS